MKKLFTLIAITATMFSASAVDADTKTIFTLPIIGDEVAEIAGEYLGYRYLSKTERDLVLSFAEMIEIKKWSPGLRRCVQRLLSDKVAVRADDALRVFRAFERLLRESGNDDDSVRDMRGMVTDSLLGDEAASVTLDDGREVDLVFSAEAAQELYEMELIGSSRSGVILSQRALPLVIPRNRVHHGDFMVTGDVTVGHQLVVCGPNSEVDIRADAGAFISTKTDSVIVLSTKGKGVIGGAGAGDIAIVAQKNLLLQACDGKITLAAQTICSSVPITVSDERIKNSITPIPSD